MEITKRQLFVSLAGLLAVLVAANMAVSMSTRNSVPRRVMTRARQATDARIAAFGNSLIAADLNELAVSRSAGLNPNAGTANIGLGASSPVEHLLLLRYALQHQVHPTIVVYGFYDFQLTTPEWVSTHDLLGNRAMLYYVEPEYARKFYGQNLHDSVEFEISRHIPMIVDRGAIWAKVERLRRRLAETGLPAEQTNEYGRAKDFSLLEPRSVSEFVQDCIASRSRNLNPAVEQIVHEIEGARANGIFVEMPMHPEHVRLFYRTPEWAQYRAHLSDLLAAQNITYLDASGWVPDQRMFADHLHLTPEGAEQFSEQLGRYLRKQLASPLESPQ
jgi:hypothetical protein